MGQSRKFMVKGWGLVINNADKTCTVIKGISGVGTTNDDIEVRAFNPQSQIQPWIDAHGLTCLNPELLEETDNEEQH